MNEKIQCRHYHKDNQYENNCESYDPNVQRTDGPALSLVYDWSVDGVKENSSTDIDVWAGINGFFNSNGVSNLDDEQSAIFNAPMLLLGIFAVGFDSTAF